MESAKYEPEQLVQLQFVLGLPHKLWNLNQLEGMCTLCMLEFDLQKPSSASAMVLYHNPIVTLLQNNASSQTFGKLYVSPVFRSSEDILAICFQILGHHSLDFFTKEFTSCGFTFFSSCSFSFVTNLADVSSLIRPQTAVFTPD